MIMYWATRYCHIVIFVLSIINVLPSMAFTPTQDYQVELSIASVNKIPGIPVMCIIKLNED